MAFTNDKLMLGACALMVWLVSSAGYADLRTEVTQATRGFKDVRLECKVVHADMTELKRIGKDFPKSFEVKNTTAFYKAPRMMRIDGKLGMVGIVLIMNGDYKGVRVPSLHITKKENIASKPDRRQTDFDLGIISESLWQDYIILDIATEKSSDGAVRKVTMVHDNDRDRKIVCWIDADTYKLMKVERYKWRGPLEARYVYSKHTYVDGAIWVPGRVDVYSPEGKLAATTLYENVKVNTNITDSLFKL
jgi:outer membrane lipoprotein-sorting protein